MSSLVKYMYLVHKMAIYAKKKMLQIKEYVFNGSTYVIRGISDKKFPVCVKTSNIFRVFRTLERG